MPSPAGTVAIVAAISLIVQCTAWLVCFILYTVAYDCVFSPTSLNYESMELDNRIILYLQGDGCMNKSVIPCYSEKLSSSATLFGFVVVGALLNLTMLIVCFILISCFWKHPVAKRPVIIGFVTCIFAVSLWDFVITGIVSSDYWQLAKNCPGNELLTIFMVSCRGGFLLASNIAFAVYLIIDLIENHKKRQVKHNFSNRNESDYKRSPQLWSTANSNGWCSGDKKEEMKVQPPSHTACSRFGAPLPSSEEQVVRSRWSEYRGKEVDNDWTVISKVYRQEQVPDREREIEEIDEWDEEPIAPEHQGLKYRRNQLSNQTQPMTPAFKLRNSKQFEDVYSSNTETEEAWEEELRKKLSGLWPEEEIARIEESRNPPAASRTQNPPSNARPKDGRDSKPSSVAGDTRRPPSAEGSQPGSTEGKSPKLPPKAFTYGFGKTFFGVRLKPVRPHDESAVEPPRVAKTNDAEQVKKEVHKSESLTTEKGEPKSPVPPPHPPPATPPNESHLYDITRPLSLQEAIMTHRLLRPVNRPAIDTQQK